MTIGTSRGSWSEPREVPQHLAGVAVPGIVVKPGPWIDPGSVIEDAIEEALDQWEGMEDYVTLFFTARYVWKVVKWVKYAVGPHPLILMQGETYTPVPIPNPFETISIVHRLEEWVQKGVYVGGIFNKLVLLSPLIVMDP